MINGLQLESPSLGIWPTILLAAVTLLLATRILSGIACLRPIDNSRDIQSVTLLPYWVPFFGHIPDFILRPDKLFERARNGNGPGIVGLNILGTTHSLVSSPKITQTVFSQKPNILSFDKFIWFFLHTVGGIPGEAKTRYDAAMHELEGAYSFLREPHLSKLMGGFVTALERNVQHLVPETLAANEARPWLHGAGLKELSREGGRARMEVSLLPLVIEFIGHQAIPSLFGTDLVRNHPSLLEDLWAFNNGFFLLGSGLPKWVPLPRLLKAHASRSRLNAALAAMHHALDAEAAGELIGTQWQALDSVSALVKERARIFRKYEIEPEARADLSVLWALNANSNFLIFWVLLRILSTEGLVQQIREESSPYIDMHSADGLKIDERGLGRCALLKACVVETLRVDSATWSLKEVLKDFTVSDSNGHAQDSHVTQYLIKRGTYIHVPSDLHFMDPAYFPSPANWRPERHVVHSEKLGEGKTAQWSSIKPWGGGSTICKGRMYAEREVMVSIAALLGVWHFEPAGDAGWHLPKKRRATGVCMTDEDVRVRISRRRVR